MKLTLGMLLLFTVVIPVHGQAQDLQSPTSRELRVAEIVRQRTPKPQKVNGESFSVIDPKPRISNQELVEVASYGTSAIKALAKYLSSKDALEQLTALRLLAAVDGEAASELLISYASQAALPSTRSNAFRFLSERRSSRIVEFMKRASQNDADAAVRAEVVRLLAEMDKPASRD